MTLALHQTKEGGTLVTTTIRDYDLAETSKLVRGAYVGIAMMVFLHGYLKCVTSEIPKRSRSPTFPRSAADTTCIMTTIHGLC